MKKTTSSILSLVQRLFAVALFAGTAGTMACVATAPDTSDEQDEEADIAEDESALLGTCSRAQKQLCKSQCAPSSFICAVEPGGEVSCGCFQGGSSTSTTTSSSSGGFDDPFVCQGTCLCQNTNTGDVVIGVLVEGTNKGECKCQCDGLLP